MENVDFELVPAKEPQVDFDLVPTKDSTTIQSVAKPAKPSTWDIVKQGFGESATGLIGRALSGEEGYTQPKFKPEGFMQELIGSGATLAGDIPAFAVSALPATLALPATWGGSATAIPATAMAGTEAFKAYMRGDSPSTIAKHAGLGGAIGGTMGALGPIAKLPGVNKFLQKTAFPLQVGGGEAVGAGLEGRDVTPEGLAITGLTLGALKAGTGGAQLAKKAIESGPRAELLAKRQAAAEKAGIPATATTGGPVQPTLKSDILSTTTAASTVAKRRRKLVDDIQKKQEDLIKFQDMLKEKQETDTKVKVEDPADVPVAAKLDAETREFVLGKVKEIGDVAKVRELYKTDSPVDVYAREQAQALFGEVKPETPSVQKLNKGALSEAEVKELVDTNLFTPEEIVAIQKLPGFKQRDQYNRIFNIVPKTSFTPESIAKANEIYNKVELAAKTRRSNIKDLEDLKKVGWSEADIAKMSETEVRRKAKIARNEINPLSPNDKQISKISEVDAELKALREELKDVPIDQITPEQEARMEKLTKKLDAEIGLDELIEPIERPKVLMQVDENGEPVMTLDAFLARKALIRERLDIAAAKSGKPKKGMYRRRPTKLEEVDEVELIPNEDLSPITDIGTKPSRTRAQEINKEREGRSGSAEEWEAKLEAEGMPAELNFDYAKKESVGEALGRIIFEQLTKDSEPARAKVEGDIDRLIARRRTIISKTKERNTLVTASKHIPLDLEKAKVWFEKLSKYDSLVDTTITHKQSAYTRKAISKAVADKVITPEEARFMNVVFSTLKKQPTFDLEIDKTGLPDKTSGLYCLADNLIKIKDPKYTAHEVAHWAFYNLLSSADRKTYYNHFMETYYRPDGKLDVIKLRRSTTDPRNAVTSPGEAFAAKMSDFMFDKVITPAEKSLFMKVTEWFNTLVNNLKKRTNTDYTGVEDIFKKILETEGERHDWKEVSIIAPEGSTRTMGSPYNAAKSISGKPVSSDFKGDIVYRPEDINKYNRSVTFDMLGFQQMYERLASLGDTFKKARMDDSGRRILGEIKGNDWGAAEEINKQTIFSTDNSKFSERLYRNLGPWIVSPMMFVKGTRNERHVYNANLAEMYIGHKFDQHRTTLDSIRLALKKGVGDPANVRKVVEGKIEGTPAEQQAAVEVRQWLDGMKERYKVFMLNEYKDNLSKSEYNALLDVISGSDIDSVKAKYPKLDTETIDSIAAKHKEIDTWGIDNYLPNVESGRFKLLVNETTKDGKSYRKLVAIGLSEKDAIRKATQYLEENPYTKELYVDTDYKMISDDKTRVTRSQYYGMMGSLAKKMTESIDGIDKGVAKNLAAATMKRKFKIIPTDSYSPFLEPRRDILKGEEDIFPVLKSYAHSIEKKMALDPVIDAIRNDLPKMNKFEKDYILKYIEDVKGRYGEVDKIVDDIFRTYRGYSRLISRVRTAEANLKLGYRPIAAGVNLASGQMHAWVKRGLPIYTEGVKFLNTPEGRKFVEDIEPFLGTNIVDTGVDIQSKTPLWKPLGLFQKPEPLNREVSAAAAYVQGLKEGMSPEAAQIFAIRANWAEQFTYNIANLPQIMRGPTGKLITQFKPYLVKEIEFMSSLSGKEWARYLGMQLALGGPRAYMIVLKSLPILSAFGFWEEAMDIGEEWMNKNMPLASRGVAGLPGLVDPKYAFDMSAAASFQFPAGPMDFAGPALSDLANIKKNVLDPLFTYGPYAEDLKKTGDIAPIIRHWTRLMKFTFTDDNWLKDTKGNKLYEVKDIVPFYLQSIAGVENVDIARIRAEERVLAQRDIRTRGLVTRIINEAMKHVIDGTPMPDDLVQRMGKYNITGDTLKRRVKRSNLPPDLRIMLDTEVIRRPEVIEQFPNNEDYGFSE